MQEQEKYNLQNRPDWACQQAWLGMSWTCALKLPNSHQASDPSSAKCKIGYFFVWVHSWYQVHIMIYRGSLAQAQVLSLFVRWLLTFDWLTVLTSQWRGRRGFSVCGRILLHEDASSRMFWTCAQSIGLAVNFSSQGLEKASSALCGKSSKRETI